MQWLYVVAVVLVVLMVVILFTGRGASSGTTDEHPPPPHRRADFTGPATPGASRQTAAPTADQLLDLRFSRAVRGYAPDDVDNLIDEVIEDLRQRGGSPLSGPTAARVRDARFPVVVRGYRMEEVDAALAAWTEPR